MRLCGQTAEVEEEAAGEGAVFADFAREIEETWDCSSRIRAENKVSRVKGLSAGVVASNVLRSAW